MYRVSVTTLEKFRRFMSEASAFDTESALIETLKGEFTGNDKTRFGSAYHKIIEGEYTAVNGLIHVSFKDGGKHYHYAFSEWQAKPGIQFKEAHPYKVKEMEVSKEFNSYLFPITITGRIDGIEGMIVNDIKTKFKPVAWQDYIDSCQWKFYLDMLGLNTFNYNLFEIKGFDAMPVDPPFIIDQKVQVIAHEPLTCSRYSGMELELQSILNDFISYIENRNFFHLLKKVEPVELDFLN